MYWTRNENMIWLVSHEKSVQIVTNEFEVYSKTEKTIWRTIKTSEAWM